MKFWLIISLVLLSPLTALASSNVEPQLCYIEIHAAIKAGAQTGRFELRDLNCAKYKMEYDRKYGDPSRPRLTDEWEFQENTNPPVNKTQARDACWDALSASDYSQKTYIKNASCRKFFEIVNMEKCLRLFRRIFTTEPLTEGASQEDLRTCQAYDYQYLSKMVR